jgi:threonine/homoserine/homoserine lactone efflux protein
MLIGFSIAAPVGPIGLLCIRRSIAQGAGYGFISGLGAATADTLYGAIAVFGLTMVANLLTSFQAFLQLGGGLFLCYLGYHTYFACVARKPATAVNGDLIGAYISVLLLTLTNPLTMLVFLSIFAGLGIGPGNGDYFTAAIFVVGVFGGSALWWLLLSGTVGLFRANFTQRQMILINKVSGIIIGCFGILVLMNMLRSLLGLGAFWMLGFHWMLDNV